MLRFDLAHVPGELNATENRFSPGHTLMMTSRKELTSHKFLPDNTQALVLTILRLELLVASHDFLNQVSISLLALKTVYSLALPGDLILVFLSSPL